MSSKKHLIILLCVFLIHSSFAQVQEFNSESDQVKYLYNWKIKNGDNNEWAQPGYDHSQWDNLIYSRSFTPDTGVSWMRAKLNIQGMEKESDKLALRVSSTLPAYQIYWDGKLIKDNGIVGIQESEQVHGKIIQIVLLNDMQLAQGEHTIAVRFSNYSINSKYTLTIYLGYITIINSEIGEYYVQNALLAGMYFITGLLCLALFWGGDKYKGYLIFALICFLYVLNSGLQSFVEYYDVSTSVSDTLKLRGLIEYFLSWILIFTFFVFNYNIPRKGWHISIYTGIVLLRLVLSNDLETLFFIRAVILTIYPIVILVYATHKRSAGSLSALLGYIAMISPSLLRFFNIYLNSFAEVIPDILFMFFIILSISIQIRERNRKNAEMEKLKHRLEQELLKKNIQPHFLMNTLHSIKSFIDEDPKKATELIHALADEFRLIVDLLDKSEISFKEEIELCKYHLKIMGFRRDSEFSLLINNGVDNDIIPPLIFHTLIENGITHAFNVHENGIFKLTRIQTGSTRTYRLTNNGTLLKEIEKLSDHEIEEGMGIRYVKARLEETYPGRWKFNYGVNDSKWVVEIEIKGA